jgi:hypothetical protein
VVCCCRYAARRRAVEVSLQKLTQLGVLSLGKRITLVIGSGA